MDSLELALNKNTFADYLLWADDKRRELIKGFIKLMSPAPHKNIRTFQAAYFLC
jgi:hypothetical protein